MNKSKLKKLQAIYAQIPDVNCKGLCHGACANIVASRAEGRIAKNKLGVDAFARNPLDLLAKISADGQSRRCPALIDNKCSMYESRPVICRLYGTTEGIECPYGCKAAVPLPREKARDLLMQAKKL